MKNLIYVFIFFVNALHISAQQIYKTPTGKRYHLSTCRMVKNVSEQIHSVNEIKQYHLTPCKICNPPLAYQIQFRESSTDKSVGSQNKSVQCKGKTKKGVRCKHRTHIANGFCFQHQSQVD